MDYEAYEPKQDEYFDQACSVAYSNMFNRKDDGYEGNIHPDDLRFVGNIPDYGHCPMPDGAVRLKGA